MNCDVAREALSARLDGEREPVPSARVDEHLEVCVACRAWLDQTKTQADGLRRLVETRPVVTPAIPIELEHALLRWRPRMGWQQWALLGVGVVQLVLAIRVGLTQAHAAGLNESMVWSGALGVAMVGAAVWPRGAVGVAGALTVFVAVSAVLVAVDEVSAAAVRMVTQLAAVIGAALAILVWRSTSAAQSKMDAIAPEPDIVLPQNASRGRRRGHLWPTDDSAA
ncbi:MAG: zf-HC2 domain-containing protein [Actinomycetota bacterium]|uniref:Zf-HC2 domain-containing protein n=1 Tax=Mycobacterium lentiflavum TaxID=141349 RepID=A0ABY3UMJ3_MYCLN|nr:zf-HC2 domain-containing protein [Mycobacterium lentiflavum]MEE3062902.1 zf-HC2 domain-containing protein [Actinomycetota bacterium]ULP40816.1 zf-HC2 domain-containing protein [Mycobacterium lentiflavum]